MKILSQNPIVNNHNIQNRNNNCNFNRNSLLNSPAIDMVSFSGVPKPASQSVEMMLERLLKKGYITEDFHNFFMQQRNAFNSNWYPKRRQEIVSEVYNTMKEMDNNAEKLAINGKNSLQETIESVKDIFGGEEDLGKYVVGRAKDVTSIKGKCKQLLKNCCRNFLDGGEPNDKQYSEFSGIISGVKNRAIWDLVGTRLSLPKGDDDEMSMVIYYIDKAINSGKLSFYRVENFYGLNTKPYINDYIFRNWKNTSFPNLKLRNGSKSTSYENGYTMCQLRCLDSKGRPYEIQIRSKNVDKIAKADETVYGARSSLSDFSGKDITYGIPELKEFYEKSGFLNTMKNLMKNETANNSYNNYLKAAYENARAADEGKEFVIPQMSDYMSRSDAEEFSSLSIENLEKFSDEVRSIRAKYGK